MRLGVVVEVHQVFILDLDRRRPLNPITGKGLARLSKGTFGLIRYRISQVLLQWGSALILEEQEELAAFLKQRGVDSVETGIVKQTGLGECFEVGRADAVEAMVIAFIPSAVS